MPSILAEEKQRMLARAKVRIKFRDLLVAGIPRRGDVLDFFIELKHMSDAEKADFKARVQSGQLTEAEKDTIKDTNWCCFEVDRDGDLCLFSGNLKKAIRETAELCGVTQIGYRKASGTKRGCQGGKATVQHGITVVPTHLKILKDGKPCKQPDRYVDKVKHPDSGPGGPRSALGRHDVFDQPEMEFFLEWPSDGVVTQKHIKEALVLAENNGLGACRSMQQGTFDVIVFEMVNDPKPAKAEKTEKAETEDADVN